MIKVEHLSKQEARRIAGLPVARVSTSAWSVSIDGDFVLFAGVARTTLLGEAELWLILGPYFTVHRLQTLRALTPLLEWVRAQYPKLVARVEPKGRRLVEFCGMKFIGWSEWPNGRRWRKYE